MSASRSDSVATAAGARSMQPYTKVQDTALLVLRLVVALVAFGAGGWSVDAIRVSGPARSTI